MGDTAEAGKNLADAKALLDGLAGRLLRAEQRAAYKLTLEQIQQQLDRFQRSPPGRLFWNPEARKMRLTLQARERLSGPHKVALIAAAQQKAKEVLGEDSQPQATGIYPMLTRLIVNLLADQRLTFGLALACMFAMGLAAFRSLWLAVISVIPTVIPIVAVLGTMGWLELPVNIATAMLASVAMGMTIDSSLVYLYRFRQEQQAGADFQTALQRTHARTGLALVVANIALVLGFAVLTWSRFVPLVHFGILTGLALLGGLIGNLLLLPLLLNLVPGFKGPGQAEQPAPHQGW
jgi:predicted RND superfamily exporter protein